MSQASNGHGPAAVGVSVRLRIKRQESPDTPPRWEEFAVPVRPRMTVISCLRHLAAHPLLANGAATTPPAWEADCLDEVCGACTMVINGKVRPACSALVEKLLPGTDDPITLEPLSKFPVVRDLMVDRTRFSADLKRLNAWVPIDGAYDLGAGPPISRRLRERRHPLAGCIGCGCCLEACPQYTATGAFVGAAVINQARVLNDHPTGAELKSQRLGALMEKGGLQDCGKAGNCVEVCPKQIPLMESIADMQRQATVHLVKSFFTA